MTSGAHECELPEPFVQGEEAECEECGAKWWADEIGRNRETGVGVWKWHRFEIPPRP